MNAPLPDPRASALRGVLRSLSSLSIKVGAAGLTYLSYVLLSRLMSNTAYGQFAFGVSLATMAAILAGMGQQTAILRFWPEELAAGRDDRARAALRAGQTLTLVAGIGLTVLVALIAVLWGAAGPGLGNVVYLLAAALLILPMAQAEYASSALRAQGSVWTALAPRDLIWRGSLCVAALLLVWAGFHLDGTSALLLAAALLVGALALQWSAARNRYMLEGGAGAVGEYWQRRGTASRWLLGGVLVDTIALNADTVVVGLLVSEEAAGLYFNAFRTAGLLTLFLFANALVIAPILSRTFHGGDLGRAQALLAASAWGGFAFALGVLGLFVVFGREVLLLFGPGYDAGYPLLLILGTGLLFDAASGPARTTLVMTGHERAYVQLFGTLIVAGVVLTLVVVPFFGVIGAALVNAGARIVSQIAVSWYCIARVGLDPTILSPLRLQKGERAA